MENGTTRRALAGGAALAVLGASAVQAAPAEAANPDAELIALCVECAKNRDLFNKCGLDADESPYWVRIPTEGGQRFRRKADTDSGGSRTVIPIDPGQP